MSYSGAIAQSQSLLNLKSSLKMSFVEKLSFLGYFSILFLYILISLCLILILTTSHGTLLTSRAVRGAHWFIAREISVSWIKISIYQTNISIHKFDYQFYIQIIIIITYFTIMYIKTIELIFTNDFHFNKNVFFYNCTYILYYTTSLKNKWPPELDPPNKRKLITFNFFFRL